ncbi:hypothetical protein HG530_012058 [Fusarium avenaceum]|nr:hypothetical protein HG530_012058 [Fusarium avenaceum]
MTDVLIIIHAQSENNLDTAVAVDNASDNAFEIGEGIGERKKDVKAVSGLGGLFSVERDSFRCLHKIADKLNGSLGDKGIGSEHLLLDLWPCSVDDAASQILVVHRSKICQRHQRLKGW